jgi:diaminopropionate ammonia-lyase
VTVATPGTVMAGLDCGTPSAVAWPALAGGLAGVVTVADDEALAAVDELGAHGVRASAGGAAAFAGLRVLTRDAAAGSLREVAQLGPESRVLVVVSGGPPEAAPPAPGAPAP